MVQVHSSPTPGRTSTLGTTAWRGFAVTALAQLIAASLQLIFVGVSSRLLSPSAFGLFAISASLLRFVTYFAGLSLSMAIIRSQQLPRQLTDSARLVAVLLGLLTSLPLVLLAGPIQGFMHADGLGEIFQILCVASFFSAIAEVPYGVLRHRLSFKQLAFADVASYSFGYILVGLSLAVAHVGASSLAWASFAAAIARLTILEFFARLPVGLNFSGTHIKYLLRYGGGLSGLNFLEFLTSTSTTLIIGRFWTATDAGYLNRAQVLVQTPSQQLASLVQRVAGSVVPKIDSAKVAMRVMQVYLLMICLLGSAAIVAAYNSSTVVGLAFGPGYEASAELLPAVAPLVALNLSLSTLSMSLELLGKIRARYLILTLRAIVLGMGLLAGILLHSLWVAIASWLLAEITATLATLLATPREIGLAWSWLARNLAAAFGLLTFVFLGMGALHLLMTGTWLALIVDAITACVLGFAYASSNIGQPIRRASHDLGFTDRLRRFSPANLRRRQEV